MANQEYISFSPTSVDTAEAENDSTPSHGSWAFQIGPTKMTYEGDYIFAPRSTSDEAATTASDSSEQPAPMKRMKHGHGVMTWEDGREYQGQFAFDKMHGHGTMIWPSGAKYVGQYCDNRKGGVGKLSLPDGSSFEGNWYKGRRHGEILYLNPERNAFRMEYDTDQVVKTESLPAFDGWTLRPGYEEFTLTEEDNAKCSDLTCCICLLDLTVGEKCARMPCDHLFHNECIQNWAIRKNQCPLCQRPIPLQRVYEI